mmetsp:Transcript_22607/g.42602  ORF Transcript_22607/g.42602 Transcript_22607/m.42602 type:complete len:244 (+) Transcript_22607:98-829(+)
MDGFALEAYLVPKCGFQPIIPGGTVPKAPNEAGSLFTEVKKNAKYPGPDHYKKEGKPFGQKAPLGMFSRISRDDKDPKKGWPAVGQYESISGMCTPRTRGGIMPKSARGCLIYDQAVTEGKWKPAPGKYNPLKPEKHVDCLQMTPENKEMAKSEKKKVTPLGPGYYSPNYMPMEKRMPAYAVPKQDARGSFLSKDKEKTPAPGSNSNMEPKSLDNTGRRKHCARLLADRKVSPRTQLIGHQNV